MVRLLSRWLPLLALLLMSGCTSLPDGAGRFEARAVKVDGETAYYQVFIPAASARTPGSLPVVLFLHGSGARRRWRETDTQGLGPYLREQAPISLRWPYFRRRRDAGNGAGATTVWPWPRWMQRSPSSVPIRRGNT